MRWKESIKRCMLGGNEIGEIRVCRMLRSINEAEKHREFGTRDKNGGFTLVELIISIAIFSLVSGAIIYFMIAGSNNYSYTKNEVNLQTESQVIMAQLNDMMREANFIDYDAANHALLIYKVVETPTEVQPKQVVDKKVVYWDSASKALYLQTFDSEAVPDYQPKDERLFSEYMNGFDVKINGSSVTVELDMKANRGRNYYKVDNTISIRNRIITFP